MRVFFCFFYKKRFYLFVCYDKIEKIRKGDIMKKLLFFAAFSTFLTGAVDAATPAQRRGRATEKSGEATSAAVKPVSARAATVKNNASAGGTASGGTVVRGRSGTTSTANTATKPVAARAGTTQKVVGTGTKVAAAAKNVIVSEECQAKYEGCMDAFCMLDNETGGRCICSDKNAEFDSILAEIEKLDQQSYKMATVGVEKLEMGDDAEEALAMAKKAADAVTAEAEKDSIKVEGEKKARRTLDLSMWNTAVDFEEDEDVFGGSSEVKDEVEGKEGDALYAAASKLCVAQIPECSKELTLLKSMYSQRVRSDCTAYENALKQQKNASAQKLAAAEQALRQTALDQYRSANKYDLGQCTVEFKKCMQTTAGCGDDFAACATISALDSTSLSKSTTDASKTYKIKGAVTTIEISAATYDMLVSKKPLCESVTKQCVKVADQVWDTFLQEVAPTMKTAEMLAESSQRQSCISTISECFHNSCKDNIDPNNPDGSYDMCITRPGTMLFNCKVQLNNCGIDASSETVAAQNPIWGYVLARLASMRVDSCTKELKACMQDADRCGPDYTNCIGLDTDTIIEMCPYDKLVSCQKEYGGETIGGEDVYDKISNLIQGLVLNIDNSMYTACKVSLDNAMTKVCGSLDSCSVNISESAAGGSLEYKICEKDTENCYVSLDLIPAEKLGAYKAVETTADDGSKKTDYVSNVSEFEFKIDGQIPWDQLVFVDGTSVKKSTTGFAYLEFKPVGDQEGLTEKQKIEIASVDAIISNTISSLLADEKLKQCIDGRTVQGLKMRGQDVGKSEARYPQLAESSKVVIADSVLRAVRQVYEKNYDELVAKRVEDTAALAELVSEHSADYMAKLQEEVDQAHKAELAAKEAEAKQEAELKAAEAEKKLAEEKAKVEEQKKANADKVALSCLQSADPELVELKGYSAELSLDKYEKKDVKQGTKTATFDPETYECKIVTRERKCNKVRVLSKKECKKWDEWDEKEQVIKYNK